MLVKYKRPIIVDVGAVVLVAGGTYAGYKIGKTVTAAAIGAGVTLTAAALVLWYINRE